MKCGACKNDHPTTSQVRACYDAKYTKAAKIIEPVVTSAEDVKPMALANPVTLPEPVPAGYYALETNGVLTFYRVKAGTKNVKVRFVDKLIGHPGDWAKVKLPYDQQKVVLSAIQCDSFTDQYSGEDTDGEVIERDLVGAAAAGARFGREHKCCSRCLSPLSDETSRKLALGPDCRKLVGWAA